MKTYPRSWSIENIRADLEERAAIYEFCAGMTRAQANVQAWITDFQLTSEPAPAEAETGQRSRETA